MIRWDYVKALLNFFHVHAFVVHEMACWLNGKLLLNIYIYVGVNLSNQAICKLSESFRQFVKLLFQLANLFFDAFKTLKPGFFWYTVDTNLFRLGPTNRKKRPCSFPCQFISHTSFFLGLLTNVRIWINVSTNLSTYPSHLRSQDYYEWTKRTKFLLAVIYGLPRRHSNSFKTFLKNWKKM